MKTKLHEKFKEDGVLVEEYWFCLHEEVFLLEFKNNEAGEITCF